MLESFCSSLLLGFMKFSLPCHNVEAVKQKKKKRKKTLKKTTRTLDLYIYHIQASFIDLRGQIRKETKLYHVKHKQVDDPLPPEIMYTWCIEW